MPTPEPGTLVTTLEHPVQNFTRADSMTKPNYFREIASRLAARQRAGTSRQSPYLDPDDSWSDRFFDTSSLKFLERNLFA